MQEYPKLTCSHCSDDPDLMGGAEECSHAYEMRAELETLRKQIKEVATLTNISQREAKEWKRKVEDATVEYQQSDLVVKRLATENLKLGGALEQIADGAGPMTASMIIAREALAFRKGD